jgi:multidrug transporter EmrE-like cation transporter
MNTQLLSAVIAGILFFIGNFFWIRSISSNKPLGNIRVVMAGVETLALFAAGLLFFKQVITLKQLIGTAIIISGIHIFGAN